MGRQFVQSGTLIYQAQLRGSHIGAGAANGTEMGLGHDGTFKLRGWLRTLLPMLQLLAGNQRDHQRQAGEQALLQAQRRYTQLAEALASYTALLPHSDYSFMTLLGEILQSACQLYCKIKHNKIKHLHLLDRFVA